MSKSPFVASNLQRAYLCPPSVWREQYAPRVPYEVQAEEGINYHRLVEEYWHAGSDAPENGLGPVRACIGLLHDLMDEYGCEQISFEKKIASEILGRNCYIDVLLESGGGHSIIIDWKFWRNPIPFDAAHDAQLLAYAVALWQESPSLATVIAVRFHPLRWDDGRKTAVEYTAPAEQWERQLQAILARSTPDAPAVPGDYQCRYCKAKSSCAEWLAWSNPSLPVIIENNLPSERLGELLNYRERVKQMASVMKQVEDMARQRLENGEPVPGFTLKEGKRRRSITNPQEAFDRVSEHISPDGFRDACSVSLPQLTRVFKAETGLKGKAAEERLEELLGDTIETKRDKPSVVDAGEDVKEIEQDA